MPEPEKAVARTLVVGTHPQAENTILGLRTGWLSGGGEGVEFELDSSAGFGGGWMALTVRFEDGSRVTEIIDMTEVVPAWVTQIVTDKMNATADG